MPRDCSHACLMPMPKPGFGKCLGMVAMLLCCMMTCSCSMRGLEAMLDHESRNLNAQIRAYNNQEAKEVRVTWEQARRRMLDEELGLKRSRSQLAETKRQRRSQWREWLPRPSLYLSIQSNINELNDLTRDDLSTSVYAPLAIPNPWTLRARAYRYALEELQAVDAYELSERRQIITLYGLFREWESMQQEDARISNAQSAEEQLMQLISSRESDVMRQERKSMLQIRFSRILNMPGVRIVPECGSLPDIDYESRLPRLEPGTNYGKLAMRLSSYQIVAAVLRSKGIQMGQWPAPGIYVGMPAIYNSRRDGNEFLDDTDEVNLFSSWSKSFDVTGRTAASLETAAEQVDFMRQSLRQQLDQNRHDWKRLNTRYGMLVEKRELLRNRLARVMSARSGDALADWEGARELIADLKELDRAKASLDVEVWIWDDDAWK